MAQSDESILVRATRLRDAARRDAEAWDDFIRRYEMLNRQGAPTEGATDPVEAFSISEPKMKKSTVVVETIEAAREFINSLGRPAGISELYGEMVRRGIEVGGKDPKSTLDARLRYSKEFVGIRGKGWWLAERPVPRPNGSAADTHEVPAAHEVSQSAGLPG